MSETLEQFTARMSLIGKEAEFLVGSRRSGHSRAVFCFDGQHCFLESRGFSPYLSLSPPWRGIFMALKEPTTWWWADFMIGGKERARRIASHYSADIFESPYSAEEGFWFHLTFKTFEGLMRFVHDRHTGVFAEIFGEKPCLVKEKA